MGAGVVVCGAHAVVYIGTKAYARVEQFAWTSSEPQREVHVVDSLEPVEQVPLGLTGSIVMSVYRLHGDGGAEGAGITVPWGDAHRARYFPIQVLDRLTDKVLFRADKVKLTAQAWTIPTKKMVTGVLSCSVLSWGNEVGVAPK